MIQRPSELPDPSLQPVAADTETCTLFVDDVETVTGTASGAVAVVSVAWGPEDNVQSAAFPFAQGKAGKERDNEQLTLGLGVDDDPNLGWDEWQTLMEWLRESRIVWHNSKFDIQHVVAGTMARPASGIGGWRGIDLQDQTIWDTMIAAREIWPTENTSLKPTAQRLWGYSQADEQKALAKYLGPKTNPRYDLVPWNVMSRYAAKDAELTLRLAHLQWRLIELGEGTPWIERELDQTVRLRRIEDRGIPYDHHASREIACQIRQQQGGLAQDLPFRPTLNEAKKYFFTSAEVTNGRGNRAKGADLIPYSVTPNGAPQLTEQVVDRICKDHDGEPAARVAAVWRDWSKLDKACSMWYEGYANKTGRDGRLRTAFRQTKVVSGRYSVERVQVQAIPQTYRLGGENGPLAGYRTPRDLIESAVRRLTGWSLFELDLEQAELRVAALFAGCETMLQLIRSGDDLHGYTATQLFGTRKGDPTWTRDRQVGKRGNFSLVFDSGWETFQGMVAKESGIYLSRSESERIVDDWRALYPEHPRAVRKWHRFVERNGYVPLQMPDGQEKWRWYWPNEDWHTAYNQRVQGSLAEYAKDWTVLTDDICRQADLDDGPIRGGLVNLVHDSQVLLLPDDLAEEIIDRVSKAGVELWDRYFPGIPGGIEAKEWNK